MVRLVFALSSVLILSSALATYFPAKIGFNSQIFAQEEEVVNLEAEQSTNSAQEEIQDVQYELAYPGMLPDHPLHFLKVLRDKVVGFLIQDPIKKTEFNILTSDKRMYAAALLAEKGKYQMALDTLSKSSNYFHEALSSINKVDDQNEILSLQDKMDKSVKKHLEAISQRIEPHLPENMKTALESEIERLNSMQNTVNELTL